MVVVAHGVVVGHGVVVSLRVVVGHGVVVSLSVVVGHGVVVSFIVVVGHGVVVSFRVVVGHGVVVIWRGAGAWVVQGLVAACALIWLIITPKTTSRHKDLTSAIALLDSVRGGLTSKMQLKIC